MIKISENPRLSYCEITWPLYVIPVNAMQRKSVESHCFSFFKISFWEEVAFKEQYKQVGFAGISGLVSFQYDYKPHYELRFFLFNPNLDQDCTQD